MSPRTAALAGSFVAANDDPNVLFYNPAAIENLNGTPVSFSFLKHLLDINSASLVGSYEFEDVGRFGGGIQFIDYGSFDKTDEYGNVNGDFGAMEMLLVVGYSNQLSENLYYGANAKFIYSAISDVSSTGAAFDVGLNYVIPDSKWSFGLSIQNIGAQISKYGEETENLPLDIRIGLAKELQHLPLKYYVSLNRLNDDSDEFIDRLKNVSVGGEFKLSKVVRIRMGYDNIKREELKLGTSAGLAGFNFGLGFDVKGYLVDYAFSSMGSIGSLHRVGISTNLE